MTQWKLSFVFNSWSRNRIWSLQYLKSSPDFPVLNANTYILQRIVVHQRKQLWFCISSFLCWNTLTLPFINSSSSRNSYLKSFYLNDLLLLQTVSSVWKKSIAADIHAFLTQIKQRLKFCGIYMRFLRNYFKINSLF